MRAWATLKGGSRGKKRPRMTTGPGSLISLWSQLNTRSSWYPSLILALRIFWFISHSRNLNFRTYHIDAHCNRIKALNSSGMHLYLVNWQRYFKTCGLTDAGVLGLSHLNESQRILPWLMLKNPCPMRCFFSGPLSSPHKREPSSPSPLNGWGQPGLSEHRPPEAIERERKRNGEANNQKNLAVGNREKSNEKFTNRRKIIFSGAQMLLQLLPHITTVNCPYSKKFHAWSDDVFYCWQGKDHCHKYYWC